MATKNAYPEKPVIALSAKQVPWQDVAAHIKSTAYPDAVKQATLAIKANESGWNSYSLNGNMFGIQADGNRWGQPWDNLVIATFEAKENSTGKMRRFCAFADWRSSVNFQLATVQRRKMFIGGLPWLIAKFFISTERDFAKAYIEEWVDGKKNGNNMNEKKIADTISIYRTAGNRLGINVAKAASPEDAKKK